MNDLNNLGSKIKVLLAKPFNSGVLQFQEMFRDEKHETRWVLLKGKAQYSIAAR